MIRFIKENLDRARTTKFWVFIKSGPIVIVSFIPPLISFILIFIWGFIRERYIPTTPQTYNYICLAISAIVTSFVGLVYIFRKEMPGPVSSITIRGGCAVATGLVLVLFFWILGIAIVVYTLLGSN
jgi:hypothetical protein